MVASLPGWVNDSGTVIVYAAAAVAVLAGMARWLRRSLTKAIDERIDPLHDRLDAHLTEEAMALTQVAASLEIIADAAKVDLPASLKVNLPRV